jgi:hypothetical protein
MKVFKFFEGFAFPFLEDVVILGWDFVNFVGGGFRFEFFGVEGFGFVVSWGIAEGEDGLFGIGLISGFFDGLVDEDVEHWSRYKYYFYLWNKFDCIVVIYEVLW